MMPIQIFATEGAQETEAVELVTEPMEIPEEETTAPAEDTEETESSGEEEKTESSESKDEAVVIVDVQTPGLAEKQHVSGLLGKRIDDRCKIGPDTCEVVKITLL
jgi:hypothetical protein